MNLRKPQFELAEEIAYKLLDKYEVDEPVVNAFDIAKKCGLSINLFNPSKNDFFSEDDISGALDSGNKMILVNSRDSTERQLFTVAHELGHYLLNHKSKKDDVLYRSDPLNSYKDSREQEANCFAASLLIPEVMLDKICDIYNFRLVGDEIKLARVFGVSLTFMKYRIKSISRFHNFQPLRQ